MIYITTAIFWVAKFRWRRCLAVVFTVMSIIAVPALSLNAESHGIPAEDVDGLSLVKYTLGNQGLHPDNIECSIAW